MIEDEIFKRCRIIPQRLLNYGFIKKENNYIYSKNIMNDSFRMDITVDSKGKLISKIIDLSFNEEYVNHRIEKQVGEFVGKIRQELEERLKDIKEKCTITEYFITEQANRISNSITEKYKDVPEFLWDNFKGYGVFRNKDNDKWYGLILNMNKNKLDKSIQDKTETNIINVKLTKEQITKLLNKPGFYEAYHMNKESWISIILDDTISDEEIMEYVTTSYDLIEKKDEWLIPANPSYYDIINYFKKEDTIIWHQSNNIKVKDSVYLYITKPYQAILYKCKVLETNIPSEHKKGSKAMKLKLERKYDQNQFTLNKLNEYNIKAVRGPRRINSKLSRKLNK